MKEATGELSTTVITIVAIAAISTLFIVFLYPQLKRNIILSNACSNGPDYKYVDDGGDYAVSCTAKDANNEWKCSYQARKSGGQAITSADSVTDNNPKTCKQN